MKHNRNSLKSYIIFAPLLLVCAAILFLGALFIQGYDVGNAMPHSQDGKIFAHDPEAEPTVDTIEIADTSNLPNNMPAVPTPARQVTTHSMKHKESVTPQPARPLPPVAEAATSSQTPVNQAVQQAVEQQQQAQQPPVVEPTPPPVDNSAPVPELPPLENPPIAQ